MVYCASVATEDQVYLGATFTNTDVSPLLPGDTLVRDLTSDNGVKRTTTIASDDVVGVALVGADPGHQVAVATVMGQRVTMRILNGAVVARGDQLVTDNTGGLVRVDNAAFFGQVIAIATRAKGAGAGTTVEGILIAAGVNVATPPPSAPNLAAVYNAGTLAAHQTMAMTDARGGGLVLDGTSGSFTGANVLRVRTAAGDVVVARASGFVGLNVVPDRQLHLYSTDPTIRLSRDNGSTTSTVDIRNTSDALEFYSANYDFVMGRLRQFNGAFYAAGGLIPSNGNIEAAEHTITFGDGSAQVFAPANCARLRFNLGANRMEISINGNAYVGIDTSP